MQEKNEIVLQSLCICNDVCYASALHVNGLFQVPEMGKAYFVSLFPDENVFSANLFVDAVNYKEYVFFVPGSAKHISVYNTEKSEFITLSIRENALINYNTRSKFSTAVCYEGCVYFLPETYPAIIKVNCENWHMDYIDDWVPQDRFSFKKGITVIDEKVYITSIWSKMYMEFDMQTNRVHIKKFPITSNNTGAWSICKNNNRMFMIAYPGPALISCDHLGNIKENTNFPSDFEDNGYAFAKGFIFNDFLYACPVSGNMMIKMQCDTLGIQKVQDEGLLKKGYKLMYLCALNKYLFFCRYNSNENVMKAVDAENIFLDTETLRACSCKFVITNKHDFDIARLKRKISIEGKIVENKENTLEHFVGLLGGTYTSEI